MKYLILLMLCIGTYGSLKATLYLFTGWMTEQFNVPTVKLVLALVQLILFGWCMGCLGYALGLEVINNSGILFYFSLYGI